MTKVEAAELLGVSDTASIADVRRRYESLLTDFQIRLTNAPTPALKKTYQQKLREVGDAADTLFPGFSVGTPGGDLPSPEPVIDAHQGRFASSTTVVHPTRQATTRDTREPITSPGLPRSTIVVGAITVVCAAALTFVTLRWTQVSRDVGRLHSEREKIVAAAAALRARVDADDRLLYADRLRVRNLSRNEVTVTAAAFIYRDMNGELKLAHSGNYGYPTWQIRPGATVQLDAEMARGREWDGPILFYSLLMDYPGVEPFVKSGIWAKDIDRLDKVVTLSLD
jgi:hypothetical protein